MVVGGGLAGQTAALTLLDRGARVILLEKEAYAGGNSRWASSGINGVDVETVAENPDSVASFARTARSLPSAAAGRGDRPRRSRTL